MCIHSVLLCDRKITFLALICASIRRFFLNTPFILHSDSLNVHARIFIHKTWFTDHNLTITFVLQYIDKHALGKRAWATGPHAPSYGFYKLHDYFRCEMNSVPKLSLFFYQFKIVQNVFICLAFYQKDYICKGHNVTFQSKASDSQKALSNRGVRMRKQNTKSAV